MVLESVPVDIETTGFDASDTVTVVGFEVPLGCRVFVHSRPGVTGDAVESAVRERVDKHVSVSLHASEAAVFEAVTGFVESHIRGEDRLLVAYNGEVWNGGFDLPFLRTRAARLGVRWPFAEVPYADLLPVVEDLFNTTVAGESAAELATAYDVLCDGALNDVDPFSDSAHAVAAFDDGRLAELVTHNVADVARTGRLAAVAEQYCAKSDFQVKSLTPTARDSG
jgi:uncharacterized protein YprB with RNaseH-like and TPR domain